MAQLSLADVDSVVELPTDSFKASITPDKTFLNDNPDWLAARKLVDQSPHEFAPWNSLVTITEQLLTKYPTPSQAVKDVITSTFDELLTRFPLFFGYWKKYTSLQYQMNGLDESIKVLSRSLVAFPSSVDLWVDYLTILVSNCQDKSKIKLEFETAISNVGHHFLSHEVWDKYIEWEQGQNNSLEVIKILLRVIRIPLHQYSRYYQSFNTMRQTISAQQLQELDKQLESATGADEYYNTIFLQTQEYVSAIWPFESQIKQPYFNITPLSDEEVEIWDSYLNLLIQRHTTDPSPLNKDQTVTTFERAIVPTALASKFWFKYLSWYITNYSDEFEPLNNIYRKILDVFLPVSMTLKLRLNYASFLEFHNRDTQTVAEVYLGIMKHAHSKNDYEPVSRYIHYICRTENDFTKVAKWLDSVVTVFYKPQTASDIGIKRFATLLNTRTIVIPIVELININWIHLKNDSNVRKYLAQFSLAEDLFGSSPFWTLKYKYFKYYRDYQELEQTVAFIKDKSSLPLTVINAILLDYTDVLAQQVPESLSTQSAYETINSLEYFVSNPFSSRYEQDEQLKKRLWQESGHPAVSIQKPFIVNSVLSKNVSETEPLPMPSFKNVERANAKIVYIENE